jgi:hypothetical protein
MVSQDKWDKAKGLVAEMQAMVATSGQRLDRVQLEQIRGFLIYVVQTYRSMTPYLICLHMTIGSWRDNRDAEGWRVKARSEPLLMSKNQEQGREGPKKVKAVPRLPEDLEALATLLGGPEPKMQRVQSSETRPKSTNHQEGIFQSKYHNI